MSLSHNNFLFISNTKQPLFTLVNIQQLFACVNINQQPSVYIQHKLLLMSNNIFLLTTLLTNYVSRNQFVNYCIYFLSNNCLHFCNQYHQPLILFLDSTIFVLSLQPRSTSHHSTHFFSASSSSTKFFHFNSTISFSCFL